MNITDIKAIVISFVTPDGSRHEFEVQITEKPSKKNRVGRSKNNGNSPQERFSHERLTVKEVAEHLGVHQWTIYAWARQGRLPCIHLSKRSLRFLKSDIDKYEKFHTSSPIRMSTGAEHE